MIAVDIEARLVRVADIEAHETIVVRCACGRIVHFSHQWLRRHGKPPPAMLIWDMQYRLRCGQCGATAGFEIAVQDDRRVNEADHPPPRVIVPAKPAPPPASAKG